MKPLELNTNDLAPAPWPALASHCPPHMLTGAAVVVPGATVTVNLAAAPYTPGKWYQAETVDELQAFYLSRLPAIREAAQAHGYAVGLHGSTRRDMDLIAVPWRDGASDADTLAHAIAKAACGIQRAGAYDWERKPAGRIATSLPICWTAWHDQPGAGHIDLSVMPAALPRPHGATCQADNSARDVCEGLYVEKCDDVIGLCEALRAVLALAGESPEVRKIVADAIAEHGGVGEA